MFFSQKKSGFTLIEVLLTITTIIIILLAATTAQISSEIFLKNIRADFEKHVEFDNAMDHIANNVRRSKYILGGLFPRTGGSTLLLNINNTVVSYSQSGDNVICSLESNPIARDARITFAVNGSVVDLRIVEDISDPEDMDKKPIPITITSSAYARDK